MIATLSVIISTYNSPTWLQKVLAGYVHQTYKDFELIIADDGSTKETKKVIDEYTHLFKRLVHVWHEDNGFRKCEILNKAIEATKTDYLVFSDGDCIPRKDFLQTHFNQRSEGRFLSGGYFKLPLSISTAITLNDIANENCFNIPWLKANGLTPSFKNLKLAKNKTLSSALNSITLTKPTWNGHNASGWKKDILQVNGFDERMKYGGEDRELGERLTNNNITGKQIRYKAICVHLDHERGYVNETDMQNNHIIRAQTKKSKSVWTNYGIIK